MRNFAILLKNNDDETISRCINTINMLSLSGTVTVHTHQKNADKLNGKIDNVKVTFDETDSDTVIRNKISRCYLGSTTGFLHVIVDNTSILKDPSTFLSDIELMMKKLNQKSWLNTSCDQMNYVYSVFNPRLKIDLDDDSVKFGLEKLIFTSHANTQWVCYDLDTIDEESMMFDEAFSVPMFYIIEYLARRRSSAKDNEMYFMNMYPTVQSEHGVFKIDSTKHEADQTIESRMKEDEAAFNAKNVDHTPTNSIDEVLERLYKILGCKSE